MKDVCKNCGGWKGLHKWDTKQCPFNGEENELWMKSHYEDAEEFDRIAALTAERDALKEALRPFAEINIDRTEDYRDEAKIFIETPVGHNATIGDIRNARALLAKLETQ